jgi:DNA-binding FadR family transcriptional regulator
VILEPDTATRIQREHHTKTLVATGTDTDAPMTSHTKESVPDTIIAALRTRIMCGEFAAGTRLPPERELAKQLGTNRTSLREALRALEAQGLVIARQGDGVRVLDFRRHGELTLLPHYFAVVQPPEKLEIITHLVHMRTILVPEVVKRCVDHATEEDIRHLRVLMGRITEADAANDTPKLMDTELAIYRSVVEAGNSLPYLWVFNTLENVIRGFATTQPGMWITIPDYVQRWERIISSIERRDCTSAQTHFRELLETIEARIHELLNMLRQFAPG